MRIVPALLLLACTGAEDPVVVDLTERLESGETRAGRIVDEASLFGGISAEGRVGDFVIYNDRVRFVVQGIREGSYYLGSGGGVIDADIVRPEGHPGRDAVDEWAGMYGLGRVIEPVEIGVPNSGGSGETAVLRVMGTEGELALIEGALESEDLIQHDGLRLVTEYRLAPDSYLLEVVTTLINPTDEVVSLHPGDILMGSLEATETYEPGVGLDGVADGAKKVSALIGLRNQVTVALLPSTGGELTAGALGLLASLADLSAGQGEEVEIEPGGDVSYSRFYGVGPDLATLTDAWMALEGESTETVSGQVTAPDGPVAGARVHVLVDDEPFTVAVTDANGDFSAEAPTAGTVTTLVDGRGRSMFFDLPDGAPSQSPYVASVPGERALAALADGAGGPAFAQGRGTSTSLVLGEPGTLHVEALDGGPFEVRVRSTASLPADDRRLLRSRPEGGSVGWGISEVDLDLEPGEYSVLVHRGIRHELHQQTVTVTAGAVVDVDADLGQAIDHAGYLLGDPHIHASPSSDAAVPMEERILGSAGVGLQLHFGTDHDHIADYRPIIDAVGLTGKLQSVVATEFSPPTRGHMNLYPLTPRPWSANGGAVPWWYDFMVPTTEMVQRVRDNDGPFILQLNHPLDSGMFQFAEWTPGVIADGERYTDDFDAIEVMNAGEYDEYLPLFFDLVNRGLRVTPNGVSDSHGHLNSMFGLSATYIGFGSKDVATYSDDGLRQAMGDRNTIVTRGPFLALSETPGSTVSSGTTLQVSALSPSWIGVDRLVLYKDGAAAETVLGTTATFDLTSSADASYVVIAEGDAPMSPLSSRTPWAMSSPIFVDADGGGWTAPLPALTVENRAR
ncbi:MAG: carboxypeptidase regulatory-like domain-containing protein [Proteobacteria bacterium]|nr:carboxypeptidase regulatory-like domain-containing protein [Pseudomonadota bacterium]